MTSCSPNDPCRARYNNVVKSESDKREYRGLELQNGMKVILVSDSTTDKSAAALSVQVGHMMDTKELPGIAHFCEHMLFMGTEVYPAENEYNKFLSEHSGSSNAYTGADETNYYFNVAPDHLEETLNIFSKFFICPLFDVSSSDREVNAVHLEHEKNLPNDTWRLNQLEKHTSDPTHDYHKFGSGNRSTLDTIPKSKGINVRDELLKFHDKWYSANIMGLAILGKESLDDLEKMVVKLFKDVKNKNVVTPKWEKHPYGPKELKKKGYVVPVKDIRNLAISFPIPDLLEEYKASPDSYLAHLIGHESPGSLLSELKNKGWCNSLSAGARSGAKGFAFFSITVDLTVEGIDHVDEVVELIFQYIKLLHDKGPQEWIFKEYKKLLDIKFRFKEKERPSGYVSSLSSRLHDYPIEEVLVAPYALVEYKPALITDLLNKLTPDNMRIAIVGKQFENICTETEPWYGTQYKLEDFSPDLLKKWKDVTLNSNMHLPEKNEFIATDFNLLKLDADIQHFPTIICNTPLIRAWLKQDDEFFVPKTNISIELFSPYAYLDPETCCMTQIFINLFKDALNEYSYDASLAGLSWGLSNTKYGMILSFAGYSHKLVNLLNKVFDKLVEFSHKVDEKRYDIVKEKYYRDLKNFEAEQPYLHASSNMSLCLSERAWDKTELLEALDHITFNKLKEFGHSLITKVFLVVFLHGNVNKETGLSVVNLLESKLKNSLHATPLLPSQVLRFREIQLPSKANYVYEKTNNVHKSSCIETYYQCGLQNTENNVVLELFTQIISEPCYDILRTKEQLGYIVMSGVRRSSGVQGLRVLIQSDRHPLYLDERIEAFLLDMRETIKSMSDETFETHKKALESQKLEKPKQMAARSSILWTEIITQQYNFDRVNVEVAYLKTVTKDMVLQFYDDLISANAPLRHKFAVHLLSQAPGGAGTLPEENKISTAPPKFIKISDITQFKSQQSLYPLPVPVISIPPPPLSKSKL